MFEFNKTSKKELNKILESLVKNEISVTTREIQNDANRCGSKFGGKPFVPADFQWPCFNAENFDGVTENRPLSFLCQIKLEEVAGFDKDGLLPEKGLILFFYERESERWGFDPDDKGCSRVYYFEDTEQLHPAEIPAELKEEYRIKEYDLIFGSRDSYPSYEELCCHSDTDCDWEKYDQALEKRGFEITFERHKLLGYADLIQGEMLNECEKAIRGLDSGGSKPRKLSEAETADIRKSSTDWILLFQMASIQDTDFEMLFGDLGNLYFYIKKEDLKNRRFDQVWLVLQCG